MKIEIPTYVVEIEPDVFDECPSLVKVDRHIGDISLKSLEAPTNFDMYKERKQITFLYRTIPNSALYGSTLLKQIIILSSVIRICKNAFYNCVSLEKIIFHTFSSLDSIGESAFFGCKSLHRIEIPSSVFDIGNNAFSECDNLTYISHSIKASIGQNAFPSKAVIVYNNDH